MKRYLVVQMCINGITKNGNDVNYDMKNVLLIVKANNKEEAIGKFVVATRNIKVQEKLNIHCHDIEDIELIS